MSQISENAHHIPDLFLPTETLVTIFNELPPTILVDLARVCRRFNAVAELLLYSSVYITDTLTETIFVPRKTLRWCEAMERRGHLIEVDSQDPPPPSNYLISACEQVAIVVRRLTPLESLELFLGPANHTIPPTVPIHAIERIIHGCYFPQLRSCSLGADWFKGVQSYTVVLSLFLAPHSALRHLKIPDHYSALDIPRESLPLLTTFRGSADTAASLLPGRPVQYLSLVGQDSDVNRENLPRMTHTTIPLRYLDLSAMSARPILLRNISAYLPTVETLRVKLALRHTLHYAFTGVRILTGLSAVLGAFHSLSFLDLGPTGVEGVGRAAPVEELAVCSEWGRACPTLRRIIFPSQTEWMIDPHEGWLLVQN
ncbi:hypothetical protein BDQ17DRAFT_1391686 [Cyathus striatus]|nr:hypothetical protein BDQ17DRAFT_1391686 [Cyathus striatus]